MPIRVSSQRVPDGQGALQEYFILNRGRRDSDKLNSSTYLERYSEDKIAEISLNSENNKDKFKTRVMSETHYNNEIELEELIREKDNELLKLTAETTTTEEKYETQVEQDDVKEEQELEEEVHNKEQEEKLKAEERQEREEVAKAEQEEKDRIAQEEVAAKAEKERLEKEAKEAQQEKERLEREEVAAKAEKERLEKEEVAAKAEKAAKAKEEKGNSSNHAAQSIKNGARNYSGNVDKNYISKPLKVTGKDRDILERLVMGEAGGEGFEGAVLVAQAIRDTMTYQGYTSVESVRKALKYSAPLKKKPNDNVLRAVEYVFDQGGMGVQHKLIYFYAPKLVKSSFHESQKFIVEYGCHRFFSTWD